MKALIDKPQKHLPHRQFRKQQHHHLISPTNTPLPKTMGWLTTTPHLHTRRPSPTTIEYTVSTLPPLTHPLRLLLITTHLIRLFLGLSILLVLYSKWFFPGSSGPYNPVDDATSASYADFVTVSVHNFLLSRAGQIYLSISKLQPTLLFPLLTVLTLLLLPRPHTHERLLAIRGLGLQVSSSAHTYLSSTSTRFIPTSQIQDIFINEAFLGFEVRFVLVIVVEGEEELVVVFPRLLPGRAMLERVWRGVRGCLFEFEGRGGKKSGKE